MKQCLICKNQFDEEESDRSVFAEAGEWLAGEVWDDAGKLCPQCLENRAMLSMMYLHEKNT